MASKVYGARRRLQRTLGALALVGASTLGGCGAPAPETASLAAATCPSGLAAFQQTVLPLVRTHCALCHDGTGNGPTTGPAFAVPDASQAYASVKTLMDFGNIAGSTFVVKGGNHHCLSRGGPADCGASPADVLGAVNSWWNQGEQTCNELGTLVSTQLALPATLPTASATFASLRWDLGSIDPSMAGVLFEVEAQHFALPSASTKGAYRFREPRIASALNPVFVKGVKLAVNGAYDGRASAFNVVRQTIMPQPIPTDPGTPLPHPSLSPFSLIVLQDKAAGDTLEVAFERLNVSTPVQCKALDKFQRVLDVLGARDCYACHGGGSANEPGTDPARQRLPLTGSPAALCLQALQRVDRFNPQTSVYTSYALRGSNDHPRAIPQAAEIEPAWEQWVAAEIAP